MDESLFWIINSGFNSPGWDQVTLAVTSPEMWLAPVIYAIGMFLARQRKKAALAIITGLLAVILGDALAYNVIKPSFARQRPCVAMQYVHVPVGVGCTDSYSFPSNHAVNSFALASAIGMVYPPTLLALGPAAVVVGMSRITAGVHYPSDVAAGALIGILIGIGAGSVARRLGRGVLEDGPESVLGKEKEMPLENDAVIATDGGEEIILEDGADG